MLLSRFIPKPIQILRVRSYPSVPIRDKALLPREPGIYYCVRGWSILYIGLAGDLYLRWNSYHFGKHHKLDELLKINDSVGDVDIHYRVLPEALIGFVEAREIRKFKPRLNKRQESIWENLNLYVLRWLAVRSLIDFVALVALAAVVVILLAVL